MYVYDYIFSSAQIWLHVGTLPVTDWTIWRTIGNTSKFEI